jgi:hypothetical protein
VLHQQPNANYSYMTKLLSVGIFLLLFSTCYAQDSIRYRTIFIGDAGEINAKQSKLIPAAAGYIISGKTSVFYLGDNIYSDGMNLTGGIETERSQKVLQSQFIPMREKGAPVYFIPGNHDWDRMGKDGLQKVKAQWNYLESQQDSLLHMIPGDGCPGPVEINLSDSLTIIAIDSEWWLFPYDKENSDADCECNTEKEILDKLEALVFKNRNKVILLASHHPFQSYGTHGGKFSWKDHLFPFTALKKNLYFPLPGLGSLYPLLRSSVFNSPEDLKHPLYASMIRQIDQSFELFPNLIHVAGHEHGLQFIKDEQTQIVSGAGARNSYTKKGRHSLFADEAQGFVTVDLLAGNQTRITFYTSKNDSIKIAFSYVQPYKNVQDIVDSLKMPSLNLDSVSVSANAEYDKRRKFHRSLFGENYRKDWNVPAKVPVIRISEFKGGLRPLERGGGFQSVSLRLADSTGKEWVLRSVNKNPDPLLPEELRQTFARDFLDDAMSAQHPYSALIVPPIADAAHVPHANPIIGIVALDSALGVYNKLFVNMLCLLEEREPLGNSDNTQKVIRNLGKDNEYMLDGKEFFNARLLDLLVGDWDRHADQWRWRTDKKSGNKSYLAVPRDRDQVLHLTQGLFPKLASISVLRTLQGFGSKIRQVDYSLIKSGFLNSRPQLQFNHSEWTSLVNEFVQRVTDSTLQNAVARLPKAVYDLRHISLLEQLKTRRNNLPAAMEKYYRFTNKIVDIQTSDKNELVDISGNADGSMTVTVDRLMKGGEIGERLMKTTYDPSITEELRIYTRRGDDSIIIDNKYSPIRLRLIKGDGNQAYNIQHSRNKLPLYTNQPTGRYYGDKSQVRTHYSKDSANTAFVPVNLYNTKLALLTAGFNLDDGLMLGSGIKVTRQEGFRKVPFTSMHQLLVSVAFATGAFKITYRGDWMRLIGKADLTTDIKVLAPDNTQNFFGVGNNTPFIKKGDYKRFYRTRFSLFQADPALRWRFRNNSNISVGPSLQFYRYDADENKGRFITNSSLIHSYDSATVDKDKGFSGLSMNYFADNRNSKVLATSGGYFKFKSLGYVGLNQYSRSFLQLTSEAAFYKSIGPRSKVTIANRVGGGVTFGDALFYQSLFLGGQDNLLGYRQYRFAGGSMFYNNLEVRINARQVGSYILPGQLGLVGFYDMGKVWADGVVSRTIHHGVGGGLYYVPAQIAVIRVVMGHSVEGWYPYFSLGFRF